MIPIPDRFNRRISQAGLSYSTKPVPHGRQFSFDDVHVTMYKSGKIQWQGAAPDKGLRRIIIKNKRAACRAADAAARKMLPRGIFE